MRIIAGRWRGHGLKTPRGRRTRPTMDRVREALMSILQPDLPGASVLDLFAGSGALGLEMLSRGARQVTFVERSASPLRALHENVRLLGTEAQTKIVRDDVQRFIAGLAAGAFDIAVADPPYGTGQAGALARAFVRGPFARTLWIEHRVGEEPATLEGAWSRRYGDTVLTKLEAAQ
jgi:16S rRNA (guanine966-N2)-methyltransferase